METHDISKFTTLMAGIGELYAKTISAQLIDIYWQVLKSYEIQDVQLAFHSHIQNPDCGQYFPKPADVLRFIEGSGETKALQAWAVVEKAIYLVGKYQSLAFDDPLIHAVLEDMGGWVQLCAITLEDMPFRANEFQKRYMGFVQRRPNRYPPYLLGITEFENSKNGYEVKAPLLIGNAQKAAQVIRGGGGCALEIQEQGRVVAKLLASLTEPKEKH